MKNCYDLFGLLRRFTPRNDSTSIFGFLNAVIQLYQYFIEISEEPTQKQVGKIHHNKIEGNLPSI
jgi:hypothetical protein